MKSTQNCKTKGRPQDFPCQEKQRKLIFKGRYQFFLSALVPLWREEKSFAKKAQDS